jgi:LPS export ABC transporter protein LptC
LKKTFEHITRSIAAFVFVAIFFSCDNKLKQVQQIGVLANAPIGEADTINLKYTDSSRLVANLLSSKMLDFSNRSFGFSEFPEGIELILYDKDNNKSKVFADYAIYYDGTGLIDLQGNVIIATHNKDSLFTPQLYYDQKSEWLFTNKTWRFVGQSKDLYGKGFDSDREFETREMLELGGDVEVNN